MKKKKEFYYNPSREISEEEARSALKKVADFLVKKAIERQRRKELDEKA